uniref:Uncharacterized protein n=1 Tax=Otus sunia TaxID=257818 RepID=A0A8C8BJZ3_9STRI
TWNEKGSFSRWNQGVCSPELCPPCSGSSLNYSFPLRLQRANLHLAVMADYKLYPKLLHLHSAVVGKGWDLGQETLQLYWLDRCFSC